MLNNRQKAYLKSLANHLKPTVMVGKEGITETVLDTFENSLIAHELVKVQVLKTCPNSIQELKIDMATETHSEIVQVIGRNIIFYRRKDKDGIKLPK